EPYRTGTTLRLGHRDPLPTEAQAGHHLGELCLREPSLVAKRLQVSGDHVLERGRTRSQPVAALDLWARRRCLSSSVDCFPKLEVSVFAAADGIEGVCPGVH